MLGIKKYFCCQGLSIKYIQKDLKINLLVYLSVTVFVVLFDSHKQIWKQLRWIISTLFTWQWSLVKGRTIVCTVIYTIRIVEYLRQWSEVIQLEVTNITCMKINAFVWGYFSLNARIFLKLHPSRRHAAFFQRMSTLWGDRIQTQIHNPKHCTERYRKKLYVFFSISALSPKFWSNAQFFLPATTIWQSPNCNLQPHPLVITPGHIELW